MLSIYNLTIIYMVDCKKKASTVLYSFSKKRLNLFPPSLNLEGVGGLRFVLSNRNWQ